MNSKEAVEFLNWLLTEKGYAGLNHQHTHVFEGIWQGKTYKEMHIADRECSMLTLKNYGSKLCQRLTKELEVPISKTSLKGEMERRFYARQKEFCSFRKSLNGNLPIGSLTIQSSWRDIRRNDYKHADTLLEAAGEVGNRKQLKLAFNALNIYRKYDNGECVAALLCHLKDLKIDDPKWKEQDTLGRKAYRFGFAGYTDSIISWLVEKHRIEDFLDQPDIARLCNTGGDSIWMSGNGIERAVLLHERSFEAAYGHDSVNHLIVASLFNKGLCYLDNRDLKKAEMWIKKSFSVMERDVDAIWTRRHLIAGWCLLAYIQVLLKREGAKELLQRAYCSLLDSNEVKFLTNWERHNLPIYVGKALHQVGRHSDAFQMYMQAHRIAISNEYIQVEAQVLVGTACLNHSRNKASNPEKSIRNIRKAFRLFNAIGAKSDAAEAQISLGEIFRDLGQTEESQKYFGFAESFYTRSNAPMQINRIHRLRLLATDQDAQVPII